MSEQDRETIKNIIATVAYYDAFGYPLTSFEIWKYMMCSKYYDEHHVHSEACLGDIVRLLEHESVRALVEKNRGMYVLKGNGSYVAERIAKGKISTQKKKKLGAIVSALKFIPFVRMIGITGTLSMNSATAKSDLDLLIVLKKGRIWTGRTLVTIAAHLLRKRRYADKIKDRVCLNYFITDGTLELITKDLFSAHEYFFMTPIFDDVVYGRFQIKNKWIKKIKPNYEVNRISPLSMRNDSDLRQFLQKFGETLLSWDFIENMLRRIEQLKIMKNPNTKKEDGLIFANDEALIFLPDPKGPKIFQKFKDNIEKLYA
jgi:hypothetical protein